jgi:hypothetical protein
MDKEIISLTPEQLRTASSHSEVHVPLDQRSDRPVCAHASHRVVAPAWPCPEAVWAHGILSAAGAIGARPR